MENQQYFDFFDNIDEFSEMELKDKIYDFTKGYNINFLISLIDEFNDFYLKKFGDYLSILSPEEEKELEPDGSIYLGIIRLFYYELYQNILIEVYYPYKWKVNTEKDFGGVLDSVYGREFTKLMTNLIIQSCSDSKIELRLIQENCIITQVDYKYLNEYLTENPFEEVFKNVEAYNLFIDFHNAYKKEEKKLLANYSYVYNAMYKDKLITCRIIDFINFLSSNYDITLDRIVYRQSGTNHRNGFYNAIKTKHKISTV